MTTKPNYKIMPEQITQTMEDAFWAEYGKGPYENVLQRCYRAMYNAAPSHNQQSARTPQDCAIEHAEYMATNGENFIEYLNEISNVEEGVLVPDDRFGDYVSGLRSVIYEFRTRRDRCPSQQSAALPVLIATRLNEAVDVLAELMDLMQGVIEGEYKPDSFTLQPARIFMDKLKFGDRCPNHESEEQ